MDVLATVAFPVEGIFNPTGSSIGTSLTNEAFLPFNGRKIF